MFDSYIPGSRSAENELNRRSDLIQSSIYGAYISGTGNNPISFHQILNRLLVLIQSPVCIALYKEEVYNGGVKSKKSHVYTGIEFIVDGKHREIYREILSSFHGKKPGVGGKYRLGRGSHKDLFDVYQTNYSFLVFSIERGINDTDNIPNFKKIKRSSDVPLGLERYIEKCCLNIFSDERSKSFNKIVSASIDNICIETDLLRPYVDKPSFSMLRVYVESRRDYESGNNAVLNKIYRKLKGVPEQIIKELASHETYMSDLPNFCLFNRTYIRPNARFESESFTGYAYDVRLCLPKEQEEDLLAYFSSLNKNDFKIQTGVLYSELVGKGHKYYRLIKSIDDKFWELLKEDSRQVVSILNEAESAYSRSFTDSVFASGVVHYRNPFSNGGIDRISDYMLYQDIMDVPGDRVADFIRIVAMYYMLDAMAPKYESRKGKKLIFAAFPIEVAGKIQSVVGFSSYLDRNDDSYLDRSFWKSTYYFYIYISMRIERLSRKKLRSIYLSKYGEYLSSELIKLIKNNAFELNRMDLVLFCDFMNGFCDNLCRIFPYKKIFIYLKNEGSSREDGSVNVFGSFDFVVELKNNNYFPSINDIEKEKGEMILSLDNVLKVVKDCSVKAEEKIIKMYAASKLR